MIQWRDEGKFFLFKKKEGVDIEDDDKVGAFPPSIFLSSFFLFLFLYPFILHPSSFILSSLKPVSRKGAGKLSIFFGVGVEELENATLQKALDSLEPSGTYFELPGTDKAKGSKDVTLLCFPCL